MRPVLVAVASVLLLTACGSTAEPSPAVTVTASPEVTEEAPADDLAVVDGYVDVSNEISAISNDITNSSNEGDILAACVLLGKAGEEGLALGDLSYEEVNVHWDKAMASYIAAGVFCSTGDYDAAAAAIGDGTAEISAATAALPDGS
jgi:hypothetical protein